MALCPSALTATLLVPLASAPQLPLTPQLEVLRQTLMLAPFKVLILGALSIGGIGDVVGSVSFGSFFCCWCC